MGGSPPPPGHSCASNGTVQSHNWSSNDTNTIYYHQPHTHPTNGPHECSYTYSNATLLGLKDNPGGSAYQTMIDRFCGHTANVAKPIPGGIICAESSAGGSIARTYCGQGDNIITQTSVCDSGEPLGAQGYQQLLNAYCTANNSKIKESGHPCAGLKTSASALYNTISEAFCEANPNDPFCSCYNVLKDKCDPTSKTGVAGCSDTGAYVDLRNATPDDFKSVWDGQRKCGSVCVGANKYIPPGITNGCKTTIQICAQDINVETASGSDIKASCELNANEGSSSGDGDGDGDGGGGGDVPAVSVSDFKTNPGSYIPKSLDGLMNDTRQKTGAAVSGTVLMSFVSACLLLVLIMSIGGGGRRGLRR